MDRPGYDADLVLWAEDQAHALREAANAIRAAGASSNLPAVDWDNVAEEIEDLGKSQRRDLASRISTILVHLLKLQASPAIDPRPGWRETIREQRDEVELVLADAKSLRQTVPDVIAKQLPKAKRRVQAAFADFPDQLPHTDVDGLVYTADQVLEDWWPPEA